MILAPEDLVIRPNTYPKTNSHVLPRGLKGLVGNRLSTSGQDQQLGAGAGEKKPDEDAAELWGSLSRNLLAR